MIIKEYTAKESSGKNRVFVDVKCSCCDKIFSRQKRQLKDFACSPICRSVLNGTRVVVSCSHCGANIYRALSKLNNSRSGHYFCNRLCKESAQKYLKDIQPDHYGKADSISSYRRNAFSHFEHKCVRCGYSANEHALQVHHKDRDRANNSLENLEILCANCHSIEHLSKGDLYGTDL